MKCEIRVQGVLDPTWSDAFAGMTFSTETLDAHPPVTTLTGSVEDQAALRGMLNKLWDLNLTLVSVACLEGREERDDRDLHATSG